MKSRIHSNSISGVAPALFFSGKMSFSFFLVVAFLIFVLAVIHPNSLSAVRTTTTDVVSPVLSAFAAPFQNIAAAVGSVSGIATLRAENAQLRAENARLKEWYQAALMLQAENQSLQDLLNLKVETSHQYMTARVLADAGNAFVKTVLVGAGGRDGVKKNQAVLAGEGMIGRVIEAGNNSSRVLLLSDINSRVPVLLEGSSQKAIITGNNTSYLYLRHLPPDAAVSEGARVVTSGDGGVFPPGLPIGRVITTKEGLMAVQLYADISKVTYVRILNSRSDTRLIRDDFTSSIQ